MIRALITALQALAASDGRPDPSGRSDPAVEAIRLVRDLEDALRLARDCPQLTFTAGQRDVLEALDRQLVRVGGRETGEAVTDRGEWQSVRRVATEALSALRAE